VIEAGAGITPTIGLRVGGSFAHGKYATHDEAPRSTDGLMMTLLGGEAEYAFRYTKLSAELVRTVFDTPADAAIAYEYFLQAAQTVTPRWSVAARNEGVSSPPLNSGSVRGVRRRMRTFEATAAWRWTPELTVRSSYYTRRSYFATTWDRQVAVSLVWARRWR
jgi:hypothetical protein